MKSKYIALGLLFGIYHLAFGIPRVFADTCTTQYGTTVCQPHNLLVNKQVKNPTTGVFVENLGTTDAVFSPGSDISYRLIIKNESGETFNPVTVKDTLPEFTTFIAGPGTFDKTTRVLTFTLENLIAGETRTVEILARVLDKSAFRTGKSFFCVTNYVHVSAPARPDGDDDSAQACIQTEVLGAKVLPVAGFNDMALLLPFIGLGSIGILLTRKAISS